MTDNIVNPAPLLMTEHQAAALTLAATRYSPTRIAVGHLSDGYLGTGLYCWPEAQPQRTAALFAKPAARPRDFAADRLPPRDEDGATCHPDLDDGIAPDERPFAPALRSIGFEMRCRHMDADPYVDAMLADSYFNGESPNFAWWKPTPPVGDHWLIASIQDTEDGPVAIFVRRVDTPGASDKPTPESARHSATITPAAAS